jgi:hypothetical protein
MNPVEVEKGVAGYLRGLTALPANVQVHEAVTAQDVDLEKRAIVAQASNLEFRSPTCFVATVEVSIRTPAQIFSQSDHSDLVDVVAKAMVNNSSFTTAFNASVSKVDMIGAAPPNFQAPTFADRAWLNVITVDIGVVDAS